MLDFLREWALALSGVAVFGSVCEVILPEGSFQKYIRLSVGMLLVLTLITPMQELLHSPLQEEKIALRHTQAYAERETMEGEEKAAVLRIYQENLNRKFLQSITRSLSDISAQVRCKVEEEEPETFGTVEEVLVLLYGEENTDATEEIKKILKQDYGVSEEQVQVRYLKERNG